MMRPCDLGDFAELSPSQKVVMLLRTLSNENLHLVYQEIAHEHIHSLTWQQHLLPSATPALQTAVLSEYLGIEQSDTGALPRLRQCLNTYAQGDGKTLAAELTGLLAGDWQSKQVSHSEAHLLFYRDLRQDHKAALLFSLTNILNEPRLLDWLPKEGYVYVMGTRPMLDNLRLMTKLRVVREFLEIPIEQAPEPNPVTEFTRLTLALKNICESDPKYFVKKVRERWPDMVVNPLLVKLFERR